MPLPLIRRRELGAGALANGAVVCGAEQVGNGGVQVVVPDSRLDT